MNQLLDHELDQDFDQAHSGGEREISLGPGTILGIFFGLSLVCGAVFGLGYSMGRHSAQNATAPVIMSSGSPAVLDSASKPAAGSAPAPAPAVVADVAPAPAPVVSAKTAPADGLIAGDRIPSKPAAAAPAPVQTAPAAAIPAAAPGGTFMVQVAAVSTQEIADMELAALKRYNYPVVVRHEPQDKLLHIQIGPYATKKDAEAMRENVLAHGFNAIVK